MEKSTDSEKTYRPHLLWVQDDFYVHLTIECENSQSCSFEVGKQLFLSTIANNKKYVVDFPLFGSIIKEECQVQWNQRQIYITLRKGSSDNWTYLTTEHEKWKPWIRTDWKEWDNNSDDDQEDDDHEIKIEEAVSNEEDLGDLLETSEKVEFHLNNDEETILDECLENLL